jgi:hypothetical protein
MADFRFSRSIVFATAIAATSLSIFGFATLSFGSAIVGETRRVELPAKFPNDGGPHSRSETDHHPGLRSSRDVGGHG